MTCSAARTLRVQAIIPSYAPIVGGMELQVERLIPFLREHAVETSILTRRLDASPRVERREGVCIRRFTTPGGPATRSLAFTAQAVGVIARHHREIDLLHAHGIMSPTTAAVTAGLPLRIPRVVTLHAAYELAHLLTKPLGGARLRAWAGGIDRFIAISSDIERLLVEHGVPHERIVAIPNGIDTQRFRMVSDAERRQLRRERGLDNRPLAVYIGRLHEVKQLDVLLRAWQSVPDARLVLLGDGDERERLTQLVGELRLCATVELRGPVNDVDAWLRAADVFVLPSRSEGLSVALLEAMSSGTLPVVTAVGGARQLIVHGENGLLVEPGDVDALAAALRDALSRSDWRASAARLARTTVERRYDLRVVARELSDVYRELVGR